MGLYYTRDDSNVRPTAIWLFADADYNILREPLERKQEIEYYIGSKKPLTIDYCQGLDCTPGTIRMSDPQLFGCLPMLICNFELLQILTIFVECVS